MLRIAPIVLAVVLVVATGCAPLSTSGHLTRRPSDARSEPATSSADTPTAAPNPTVPAAALDRARRLGGGSQKGTKLYLIVGYSSASLASAEHALARSQDSFGEMQDYFVLQRAEAFSGIAADGWVVVEAHRVRASAESELDFARRAFPDARVVGVVVRSDEPLPVYEDLVPGAE